MTESWTLLPSRDWQRIQKLGLTTVRESPESYAIKVAQGMNIAAVALAVKKELIPSLDLIKGLHYAAFESVHSWAGTFRKEGQEVMVGNLICSDSKDITRELASLSKEMTSNPLTGTNKYKSEALAFYHASLLVIHPFLDGNGRIARTILDHQSLEMLGHPLKYNFSREAYTEALVRAQETGDLKKLAKIISGATIERKITIDRNPSRKREDLPSASVEVKEHGRAKGEVKISQTNISTIRPEQKIKNDLAPKRRR